MNVLSRWFDPNHGNKPFLISRDYQWSYTNLYTAVAQASSYLQSKGVQQGDRVLIVADNSAFWITAYLATLHAGAVAVPLPHTSSREDVLMAKTEVEPTVVLIQELRAKRLDMKRNEKTIFDSDFMRDIKTSEASCLIEPHQGRAAIMFTSGSSGQRKGVLVTHNNLLVNTEDIVSMLNICPQDRMMVVLPFSYCFGASLLHTHLHTGGSLVLENQFMFPQRVLENLKTHECTGFAGVPSHFKTLLHQTKISEMSFPRLRHVQQAGGKLDNKDIELLRQALPTTEIAVMYGQTEATARLSILLPKDLKNKIGSIGKGLPHIQLKVVNSEGKEVEPGENGEIVATGDSICPGYWKNGNVVEQEQPLRTGDLGFSDKEGYIYIQGRKSDFLKVAGRRLGREEIRQHFSTFSGLKDIAVVGIEDDQLGEAVKVFVVPALSANQTEDEWRNEFDHFCQKHIPRELRPKEIVIKTELPRTDRGKIALDQLLRSG